MRKWYIALLTLLAFTACQQEPLLHEGNGTGNSFDPSQLRFNLTIEHPDGAATKGVKKVWKDGDKVFLFIKDVTTGYLTATLTYTPGETPWAIASEGTAPLGDSGTLYAVYLPYGNGVTPSYNDGQWSFSGGTVGTDTYYFYASAEYTVSNSVLSATVQMVKPMDYVQFFIPHAGASGTIQLACNALRPAGFASIAADTGAITEKPLGTAGTPIHGYPDTLEGEEGYYVSGKSMDSPGADYYFALQKANGTSYAHFYKNRTAIVANKAYELPAYSSWPTVGGDRCVLIAGGRWKTVNEGASYPWSFGDPKTNTFVPENGEALPTEDDWTNLMDGEKATWKVMDIWGQRGYLVVSETTPTNYIFLPRSTSSATDYWINEFSSVVRLAADGTRTNGFTPAPGSAYARLIEKLSYFKIKAKFDETTITSFKHDNGTIQYSDDYGGSWNTYNGQHLSLNADDEVWFRGNLADCNCTGSTQLFKADKVCYIAGDITSLLANPNTLPDDAFRSAFSFGNISNANADLEKNLPRVETTVDWVDIDPGDPLILPASTSTRCYLEMFMGCISLHSAPALPATDLAEKCYFRMFYGCTGLSSIPSFPSEVTWSGTNARRRQCFQMFQSCTGITTLTGSLPATLDANCFEDMFAHCTGLTSVASGFLPATTLAAHCYRGMFQDTRFERAPVLPATNLVSECYRYMFNACTRLNYIKCLATTHLGNGYTTNWVSDDGNKKVPNTDACTFVRADAATSWPSGTHGILSNWTVKRASEE